MVIHNLNLTFKNPKTAHSFVMNYKKITKNECRFLKFSMTTVFDTSPPLYAFTQTAMTGSIFMTVAIAFERYTAVHNPVDYNQVRFCSKSYGRTIVTSFCRIVILCHI
jgi:hypothetical protein